MNRTLPSLPQLRRELDQNWIRLTLIAWVGVVAWYVWQRWGTIYWFGLGDTDDNMRMMQVRALLDGQGWYDLRQYRMNPPVGFDIHWSRLVDLPIAGLILFFRLFTTHFWADRLAAGFAPLIPLSIAFLGLGFTVRRLVSPYAWPLAIAFLLTAPATMPMFMPNRIDHHGWQLAFLSLTLAGLVDERRFRGGVMTALSTAASLAIGLEMIPFCAVAGGVLALRWIFDREEAKRLSAYGLTLAVGTSILFGIFVSKANLVLRCDALTPVWLSVVVSAGLLLFALAAWSPSSRTLRLVGAAAAGALIAAGFVFFFPQCLGRPEQVSPELARNWLDNVREAKPIYKQPLDMRVALGVLPAIGILTTIVMLWRSRRTRAAIGWGTVLVLVLLGSGMLFWQIRVGAAAQLLSVPGTVAVVWWLVPLCLGSRNVLVRIVGPVVAVIAVSGVFAGYVLNALPGEPVNQRLKTVREATHLCPTLPALLPLNRYPAQVVFTFVDMGPRLIATTHHDAVAGPYHRNGAAILDVQHAFEGSPATFRRIARKHHATLLLICPNMAESTNYRARAPGGFYDQLAHGKTFPWLVQLPLPRKDPLRLYQIEG